jgi:hypothetical protein
MIRLGQTGLGMLTLPELLAAQARPTPPKRSAKHCIYLFLWGGPPQMDLWDPKPDAPDGIRSLFQPMATNVPGMHIMDQMPRLAQRMDKIAIVRSLSHDSDIHEPSVYRMLTGRRDMPFTVPNNVRRRKDFPNVGSIIGHFSEPGVLPASVTVPRPVGHSGVTYAGTYAGWLGPRFDPMELKPAGDTKDTPAHATGLPDGLDPTRLVARRGLVQLLEEQDRRLQRSRGMADLDDFAEQAYRMLSTPEAKRAFNLDLEPPRVRDRYGRNEYGESFLLARRLVEAGVRLVTCTWLYIYPHGQVSNVWDNHAGYGIHGAKTGYDLLKSPVCIPPLDQALSALLDDLAESGLLDETLVVAAGEFGRTPKINKDGGRDHWGACQSALFAGGGIRGGQVYGASDKTAAYVKDQPVSPEDFIATILHAFGLPAETELVDREQRPHRICEGRGVERLFA